MQEQKRKDERAQTLMASIQQAQDKIKDLEEKNVVAGKKVKELNQMVKKDQEKLDKIMMESIEHAPASKGGERPKGERKSSVGIGSELGGVRDKKHEQEEEPGKKDLEENQSQKSVGNPKAEHGEKKEEEGTNELNTIEQNLKQQK